VLREEGGRGLWIRLLGETVYRRLLVLDRRLDEPIVELSPSAPIEIRLTEDAKVSSRFRGEPEETALRRLAEGHRCFVAYLGDRIVGVTWARPGGGYVPYLGNELELGRDDVYISDVFVDPELRGLGIAQCLAIAYLRFFAAAGFRRTIALVMPENRSSRRACAAVGYRICGRFGTIGFGPFSRVFRRDLAERVPAA
jgi:RimJ/RimL family protein N-acetyltransferase